MRLIIRDRGRITVELTRRNLRTLLAKLDEPQSFRTLQKTNEPLGWEYAVVAVEDDAHYATREPGQVHPDTLAKMEGDGYAPGS